MVILFAVSISNAVIPLPRETEVIECTLDQQYYIISYPGSCLKYVQCINGVPNVMNCTDGTLFNPETLRCEVAENVECVY